MATHNLKDVLREAREAERAGKKKLASAHYSTIAIALRRRKRNEEAKSMLEHAIKLSPHSPRLYVQLALCFLAEQEPDSAERAIETFTQEALQKDKIDEYAAYMESQLKDYASLRQIFYQARLQIDRTSALPFLNLAKVYEEQTLFDKAERLLIDALKTKSYDSEVIGRLKGILSRTSNSAALASLANFEAGKLSREDLIQILSGPKPHPKAPSETAGKEDEKGKKEKEKDLQTLIADLEAELGLELREPHDQVAPLIREFRRKAQEVLGSDAKARIDLALAFSEMGLMEDARDELKPISVTDPLFLEAQCLLGEILLSDRSELGALEIFQQCLRDERASSEIRKEATYKLLLIYYRLGDLKQALHWATTLEKLAPDYRDLKRLTLQIRESLDING